MSTFSMRCRFPHGPGDYPTLRWSWIMHERSRTSLAEFWRICYVR